MTSVATAGTASLKLSRAGSNTVLERVFATNPLKLFSTSTRGAACWIYAATLGGGFVGGDDVRMSLEICAGATALLTTQASTKIYRSLKPARQTIAARIDDGALLAVVPDPVVCFADADFSQDQTYTLAPTGNLVLVDWMTSGRQASGERWMFTRYASRIRIERGGDLIVFDNITLERGREVLVEGMSRFNVCATVIVVGPRLEQPAGVMAEEVSALAVRANAGVIESASPIRGGGVLLRIMGTSVEQVGSLIRKRLEFLVPFLGDDPWRRKW